MGAVLKGRGYWKLNGVMGRWYAYVNTDILVPGTVHDTESVKARERNRDDLTKRLLRTHIQLKVVGLVVLEARHNANRRQVA